MNMKIDLNNIDTRSFAYLIGELWDGNEEIAVEFAEKLLSTPDEVTLFQYFLENFNAEEVTSLETQRWVYSWLI